MIMPNEHQASKHGVSLLLSRSLLGKAAGTDNKFPEVRHHVRS